MKKVSFYLFFIFILTSIILITDLVLSNSFLKYKNCFNYEKFYYELKKNCKGTYRFKKSFPLVETITDEMGLRVGSKSSKSKDKKNIFIFGDSFTYGVGIEYDKTFVGLIEKEMKDYNIYNFGVGSYSPSVYLYKLKKTLKLDIFPKKIFLFLDLTDILDEANRWEYNKELNQVKLKSDYIYRNSQKKEKFIKQNFKILTNLTSYVNFHLRNLRETMKIKIKNERKIKTSIQGSFTYTERNLLDKRFWEEKLFERGISELKYKVSEISDISKQIKSDFYVIIYPWAETLEFGQNKFNWSIFANEICSPNKCKVIDAIPDFKLYKKKNINWSNELYFLNDEHFNEVGASVLFQAVIKNIN